MLQSSGASVGVDDLLPAVAILREHVKGQEYHRQDDEHRGSFHEFIPFFGIVLPFFQQKFRLLVQYIVQAAGICPGISVKSMLQLP